MLFFRRPTRLCANFEQVIRRYYFHNYIKRFPDVPFKKPHSFSADNRRVVPRRYLFCCVIADLGEFRIDSVFEKSKRYAFKY